MIEFVEKLLKHGLSLAEDVALQTKEEILRSAWQKMGFMWKNIQINLDNDYAPSVLKKGSST